MEYTMTGQNLEKIHAWFKKLGIAFIKFRWGIIVGLIILLIISAAGFTRLEIDGSTESWFNEGAAIKRAQDEFETHFSNNAFIGLLITSDNVFSHKTLTLIKELGEELTTNVDYADTVMSIADLEFSEVIDGDIYIDDLVPSPVPEDEESLSIIRKKALGKHFLVNRIFTDDLTEAWLLLRLTPFPKDWMHNQAIIKQSFTTLTKDYQTTFITNYRTSGKKAYDDLLIHLNDWGKQYFLYYTDYEMLITNAERQTKPEKKYTSFIKAVKQQITAQTGPPEKRVGKQVTTIIRSDKYKDLKIKAVGGPIMNYNEMTLLQKEFGQLMLLAIVIGILILIIFLRSLRGVVIPLISTFSSIFIVYGFMGHLGVKINAITMSVPVFVGFAVSIGYSIHLFNFYKRHFIQTGKRRASIIFSVGESGWPVFFTALTTIAALISFYFIDLVPIQWLGLSTASVILVVYIITMTLTPALLSFGGNRTKKEDTGNQKFARIDALFIKYTDFILKHSLAIVIIFIIISAVCIYGLFKLEINITTKNSYGPKVAFINEMLETAASKIGSFTSYDLVITFDEDDAVKEPEVLRQFELFLKEIEAKSMTKRVSSILDTVKDMNQLLNDDDPAFYTIPDNKQLISQLLFLYELSGGTQNSQWADTNYRKLRAFIEVSEVNAEKIRQTIIELNHTYKKYLPQGTLSITGGMPQFAALNYFVSRGQIYSVFIAVLIITILMIIVFKSYTTGLIGMIPNIAPVITVGGMMGLLGISINFMTATLMPLILGLAVDDTIHFISHAKLEFSRQKNYHRAITNTFKAVGRSIFMTSMILVAAFMIYFTSIIKMNNQLGLFLIIGITTALITDYFITPIVIKWFKPFGEEEQ